MDELRLTVICLRLCKINSENGKYGIVLGPYGGGGFLIGEYRTKREAEKMLRLRKIQCDMHTGLLLSLSRQLVDAIMPPAAEGDTEA